MLLELAVIDTRAVAELTGTKHLTLLEWLNSEPRRAMFARRYRKKGWGKVRVFTIAEVRKIISLRSWETPASQVRTSEKFWRKPWKQKSPKRAERLSEYSRRVEQSRAAGVEQSRAARVEQSRAAPTAE